ncbi:MAG: hypothetical protein A2W01_07850 [Candidatus Solincola sediminis]|nr:MAG: hypothetical protein A2W01_07850 [Candidatus Solincola sediminis]
MKSQLSERKKRILAFIFFLGIAIFLTWPLLPNLFKSVYGEVGDPVASVWAFKWFRNTALSGHSGALNYPYAGYPDGINGLLPLPLLLMPLTLLTYLPHGETMLYNLIVLMSIALSGFIMYLLGWKLFKSRYAAIAMGLVFMFCPYALARARYHLTLVEIFIFPLILYALLNLKEDFNNRNKIFFTLALLLALNIHPYYSGMILLMLSVLFIYYVLRRFRQGDVRSSYGIIRFGLLTTAIAVIMSGAFSYIQVSTVNGGLASVSRLEGDLYTYAAHPWNYFVPSTHSALFGGASTQFVAGKLLPTNIEEYVLFLGYVNMGLALIALVFWLFRRRSKYVASMTSDLQKQASWLIPFALCLGLVAFLFSLQPVINIGALKIYMPSWFIFKIFPFIRVYSRFGVLVFFAITLMSGACLAFLGKAIMGRKRLLGTLAIVLIAGLMLSEFIETGPKPMQALYQPNIIYTAMQELPDDTVIVEYPFVASDESYSYLFLWNQFYHRKSMLNGYPLGSQGEAMRLTVLNLLDPKTPGLLAYMGVDYVMVHKDMYEKGSSYTYTKGAIDLNELPRGLELTKEDSDCALLKINGERPDAIVLYDPTCSMAAAPGMGPGLWLQFGKQWIMKIDAVRDLTADISFSILSVEGVRDLTIETGSDRKIVQSIGQDMENITIRGVSLKRGMNEITLSTSAEQVAYNKVFGGNDLKEVSFIMSFWGIEGAAKTVDVGKGD